MQKSEAFAVSILINVVLCLAFAILAAISLYHDSREKSVQAVRNEACQQQAVVIDGWRDKITSYQLLLKKCTERSEHETQHLKIAGGLLDHYGWRLAATTPKACEEDLAGPLRDVTEATDLKLAEGACKKK